MKLIELIGRLVEIEKVYGGNIEVRCMSDEGDHCDVEWVDRVRADTYSSKDGKITHHEAYEILIR